jgi:hypothetical protein
MDVSPQVIAEFVRVTLDFLHYGTFLKVIPCFFESREENGENRLAAVHSSTF